MSEKLYLAKQKIFNTNGNVFASELLFRDTAEGIKEFPTHIKATSHVIINAVTNIDLDEMLGKNGIALVNIDEQMLLSGIIDMLDKKRFVLELLETVDLSEKVVERIKQYHKRGYKIAIDDFDCSPEMIKKFAPLLKYIHVIKIDVTTAEPGNLDIVIKKLKTIGMTILAEKIETKEEYEKYKSMGFDLFQGYFFHKPEVVEVNSMKEVTHLIILQLIRLIKNDAETAKIEMFIKQRADLSYKLIKFLNNQEAFETEVESITQVITLLGRDKLLRWLLVYLYSEISKNPASEIILQLALKRAEKMEEEAHPRDKEKAYLAGMFSLLSAVFETNAKELMAKVNLDNDITRLVVEKKGKFAYSLMKIEKEEKEFLKNVFFQNFEKLDTVDLIYLLESKGIHIDENSL